MAFDGNEGEQITITEGSAWTKTYQSRNEGKVKAHFYGINKLNEILTQPGCQGIRIYRAIDDNGADCLVLVGSDEDENDMTDGVLIEMGVKCPPRCKADSPLDHQI